MKKLFIIILLLFVMLIILNIVEKNRDPVYSLYDSELATTMESNYYFFDTHDLKEYLRKLEELQSANAEIIGVSCGYGPTYNITYKY